jgi:hypothetical protein
MLELAIGPETDEFLQGNAGNSHTDTNVVKPFVDRYNFADRSIVQLTMTNKLIYVRVADTRRGL